VQECIARLSPRLAFADKVFTERTRGRGIASLAEGGGALWWCGGSRWNTWCAVNSPLGCHPDALFASDKVTVL